jgi:phage shock protein E
MIGLFGKRTQTMSMREAKEELEKDKSIILLDVRTKEEYRQGHIRGSVNIPLDRLPYALPQLAEKGRRIFIYCLSGARSSQACHWLARQGYENVTNIGAITAWSGPVVR